MRQPVQALDTLLAMKVLALHEGLRNSDRVVACILIEHFNRRTGRLDLSIERVAKLAELHTRTVIRAIERLVRLRLFRKVRHGGYSNRNRYEPNWQLFAELHGRWNKRFGRKSRTPESHGDGPQCHLSGDISATQTDSSNRLRQTFEKGSRRKEKECPGFASRSQGSAQASRTVAQRRWDKDLLDHFKGQAKEYSRVVEAIDQTLSDAATDAEQKRRGAGIELILQLIRRV